MNGLEMMMTLVFVVPIAAACVLFLLCAAWMQVKEEQRQEAQIQASLMRRRARRAAYHAA